MTSSDADRLVGYIQSLPNFTFYETIDGNYDHIGATLTDALLQAKHKYSTQVKPRVNQILGQYPEMRTTSALLCLLQSVSITEFLRWRDEALARRFRQVLELFATEGIQVEADLRQWLANEDNLEKLAGINGIGPKTIDYFKILVGISTSAIDRHLLQFLALAGLSPCTYQDAQAIVNAAADILSVDRARFDHSIWQFMSKRAASQSKSKVVCRRSARRLSTKPA